MRRTLISAATVVSTVTAASLLLAPVASASGKPQGDNGTVKIHDAKTGEELMKNEPHVCIFYLDGFKFDGAQKVDWTIEGQAPTKDLKGTKGSLVLDGTGHERTADLTLPEGHYKLFWKFDNENGKAKHKVFWVDCEGNGPGKPGEPTPTKPGTEPTTPGTEPTTPGTEPTTPGTEPTTPGTEPTKPGETPGSSESPSPSASTPAGTTNGGANGGSTGGDKGNLAETGSSAPVGILAGVAVALAAAGAFLVSRRRKAQQH
ncbi:LPXTG cell wall anchor domain-containing protein [Streptomyces sp. NPDC004267]|uniref:LPXTG cell wall anchor domain-containing protein n=1 Tax=Streptomyces sp. NPDC004267 TaxID=3364694 RepID=UPI0036A3AD94